MTKRYSLKNALEQLQDDLTDERLNVPVDQEDADISEDFIDEDLRDSSDLSEDITSLATASESLESLAFALEQDLFPNHEASYTEIQSVRMALESYGLESGSNLVAQKETKETKKTGTALTTTTPEPTTKKSLKDRVVAGAKAIWDWIIGIGQKIADWVAKIFVRMTTPMLTYEKRMYEVVRNTRGDVKKVSGEKYAKYLSSDKKLSPAIAELITFSNKLSDANNSLEVKTFIDLIGSKVDTTNKIFVKVHELTEKYIECYSVLKNDVHYTNPFIGGYVFSMKYTHINHKLNYEHGYSQEKEAGKAPETLSSNDLKELGDTVKKGVESWKKAQASVAKMKIDQVAKSLKTAAKQHDDEMQDAAKQMIRILPKMLKSPVVDSAMVLARVIGATVSFAEAHVDKDAEEKPVRFTDDRYSKFKRKNEQKTNETI